VASFAVAWVCTTGAALVSYPLDTVRRRMMMTSGSGQKYKGFVDAGRQIVAKEGARSLFAGAGANILRGVAGALVLSLYDKYVLGRRSITWHLTIVLLQVPTACLREVLFCWLGMIRQSIRCCITHTESIVLHYSHPLLFK
jgi:hypothetical protein